MDRTVEAYPKLNKLPIAAEPKLRRGQRDH